jgi:hypothetical protein
MIRLRTSRRTNAKISAATASNSLGEPLFRSQLSTRWAAMMLPPDIAVMWRTRDKMPASRRKRMNPR